MNSLDFFNSSVKNMEEKRAIPEDTYFFILEYYTVVVPWTFA